MEVRQYVFIGLHVGMRKATNSLDVRIVSVVTEVILGKQRVLHYDAPGVEGTYIMTVWPLAWGEEDLAQASSHMLAGNTTNIIYMYTTFTTHQYYTVISFLFRRENIFRRYSVSENLLHKNYSTMVVTVRMVTLVRNLFHTKYHQPKIK